MVLGWTVNEGIGGRTVGVFVGVEFVPPVTLVVEIFSEIVLVRVDCIAFALTDFATGGIINKGLAD